MEATADQVSTFANTGAFSLYLKGRKPDGRAKVVVNGRRYRVDAFAEDRRVVVRESRLRSGRVRGWSLFECEAPRNKGLTEWADVYCGSIALGQFAVLLQQEKVAAMIHELFE